ncbi:MAG: glucoamylase family protein, partial [Eubacteriales bacterium]|nr:glucoamylase family protein [Eubacteriales bacterium]
MGWERKRGALIELNALLSGSDGTSFILRPPDMPWVRYVLTLDADTRLPLEMAKKLVGTISHPLNQLELDEGRPVRGYGLIQPRIGVSVESVSKSWFARVMAGPGGTDTYTSAISDVYQDWFGQGVFTGKGIYDISAAHSLLRAVPENSILSHDLLEGGLLRTGLATYLELVDDFPARYSSYIARGHRWTRGDWQLLPWLGGRVAGRENPLALITRWQIFDNLRRSLVPVFQMLFFAMSLLAPGMPWILAGMFLGTLLLPAFFALLDYNWRGYLLIKAAGFKSRLSGPRAWLHRLGWQLAFLPYQAWVNADAIGRTLYRLFISRKNLLEWTTAAEAEKKAGDNYRRQFRPALLAAAAIALPLAIFRPLNLAIYLPLLALWLYSPALAFMVSQGEEAVETLAAEDKDLLRKLALDTWRYYEELTVEETCYLPPDNYQAKPPTGSDYRTSPTNIGFYLLSTLAARDFGFISTLETLDRIDKTLSSVESMEKWKGHLYNWYAIRDLELLRPRFISTVDSGNIACMLVALAQGLREYLDRPLFDAASIQGLLEALGTEAAPPFTDSLDSWEDILAQPASDASPRGRQLLNEYREELDSLFPHTEILAHPPEFLQRDPAFRRLAQLAKGAAENPSPGNLARSYEEMLREIDFLLGEGADWQDYLLVWKDDLLRVAAAAKELTGEIHRLIARMEALVNGMDFSALYNTRRNLFSIGYSVDEEKLIESNYDLLASEARLASYLAIVLGHVPAKHWRKLGRALVRVEGTRALVSWSGTMFEYLMPLLLTKNYANTLLAETAESVIAAQRSYAEKRHVPWGVSESGYYAFDYRLNYQYRAFGIPKLGLKRGLVEDMVVSPYSTMLALPFAPGAAMDNVRRLLSEGMGGEYGLFEAADYTPQRVPAKKQKAVVQSYFAHHQGMSLISLANYLNDFAMVRRFHSDPRIRAGELLLQETPSLQPVLSKQIREPALQLQDRTDEEREVVRSFGLPQGTPPNCHLLSNGNYTVLLTDSGSGYSRNEQVQVSRWRENPGYKYGTFIFIKSLNTDEVWSATLAPFRHEPDFYRVRFFQDRASYFRETANIDTKTEVIVSTEDNAEVRRVTLTNHGTKEASLEITSFFELALSHQDSDLAHPAFNNLFVQTEPVSEHCGLLAFRRPRSEKDPSLYALHQVTVEGESVGSVQYETDRGKFIGRGRDISCPVALHQPLTNTSGQVLDPVMSLRRQIKLGPGQSAALTFITAQGGSRGEMLKLSGKYSDPAAGQRAFDMATTRSLVERRFLNLSPQLLTASQQAIGHLVFLSPSRRRYEELLAQNTLAQQGLWAEGISGDNPMVLVCAEDAEEIRIVEEAILAHEYWRFKGLEVDLVILHGGAGGYLEPVRDLVRDMVQLNRIADILDKPGGIYIRSAKQLTEAERCLFHAAARLILRQGTLAEQLKAETPSLPGIKDFTGPDQESAAAGSFPEELLYYNGFGGFSPEGREYVIRLQQRMTPAPWLNVLANPDFGCIVSERGGGFVFAENSRENKLTPWSNDPVSDPPGEIIYLRDEDSGAVWTVCAAPIWEQQPYTVRHGQGYSKFCHHSHGLDQELTVFVPPEDPVKLSLLKIRNDSPGCRRLTVTYFMRPVLGVSDQISHLHLISSWQENMLTFRNPYNGDFPGRIAWISASR